MEWIFLLVCAAWGGFCGYRIGHANGRLEGFEDGWFEADLSLRRIYGIYQSESGP